MQDFDPSLPALAMIVGVGLGIVLVLTRSLWKSLPGWMKFLAFVAFIAFIVLLAMGRIPLP